MASPLHSQQPVDRLKALDRRFHISVIFSYCMQAGAVIGEGHWREACLTCDSPWVMAPLFAEVHPQVTLFRVDITSLWYPYKIHSVILLERVEKWAISARDVRPCRTTSHARFGRGSGVLYLHIAESESHAHPKSKYTNISNWIVVVLELRVWVHPRGGTHMPHKYFRR